MSDKSNGEAVGNGAFWSPAKIPINQQINGADKQIEVASGMTLLDLRRERRDLTGEGNDFRNGG